MSEYESKEFWKNAPKGATHYGQRTKSSMEGWFKITAAGYQFISKHKPKDNWNGNGTQGRIPDSDIPMTPRPGTVKELLEEDKRVAKMLIDEHDLNEPMKPLARMGFTEWNKIPPEERQDMERKHNACWAEWRDDLEALQYGMRLTMNALLQHRLDLIMENRKSTGG